MATTDGMKGTIGRIKAAAAELEADVLALERSDLARENAELKARLEKLGADCERARGEAAELTARSAALQNSLYEHIYNEKLKIVNSAERKAEIYFRSAVDGELNRLAAVERSARNRIDALRDALAAEIEDTDIEVRALLYEASAALDRGLTEARATAAAPGAFTQRERDALDALKREQIGDEQVREVTKKNNLERFVGLNVLNAVGIFLLIIGAIALARFTYLQLNDTLKAFMLFVLGGALLAAGELLNRKKPGVFSLGLSAGGIGILYAALATGYFGLRVIGMYPALGVCVLITAAAFVLSNRYASQTIAAFALIGGYLPMFSIGSGADDANLDAVRYGMMVYFIALNLLALLISFHKRWRVTAFIGLFLNICGSAYVWLTFFNAGDALSKALTVLYVLFAFLVYTAIPVAGTYRAGGRFRPSDVALLAINTFFGCLIIYGVFWSYGLGDYNGLLAACFAALYLGLGRFVERKFTGDERHTRALFYLTGLAFAVLIIPMQFGRVWLSLGWLAEGVALAAYGVLADKKTYRRAGRAICVCCLCAFCIYDCAYMSEPLFVWKYAAVTLGSLIILGAYMRKKATAGGFVAVYKYFALVNLWIYAMYLVNVKLWAVLRPAAWAILRPADYSTAASSPFELRYLLAAASVAVTFVLAYIYPRIRCLAGTGMKILSVALHAVGILMLFALNAFMSPVARGYLRPDTASVPVTLAGTAILTVLCALSVLATRDLVRTAVTGRGLSVEWYPLIISAYFVIVLTQNLVTQFGLSFSSAAISIIYVLAALAWTVYGFWRRYAFIRRSGLGLALLAVVKLFLVDLYSLTEGFRIISYFALGAALVAISFVYQYFNRRLELKWDGGTVDKSEEKSE